MSALPGFWFAMETDRGRMERAGESKGGRTNSRETRGALIAGEKQREEAETTARKNAGITATTSAGGSMERPRERAGSSGEQSRGRPIGGGALVATEKTNVPVELTGGPSGGPGKSKSSRAARGVKGGGERSVEENEMDGQSRARGVGGGGGRSGDGGAGVGTCERRGGLREPSTSNFSGMHCNMQQMGLYEKFPSDTPILVEFKSILLNILKSQTVNKSQQIASFSLTPEESAFLDAHYLYMRPDCVRENVDDDGKFFISPKGRPIRSASNDLSRLHAHYKIPSVTSQEIRRVQKRGRDSSEEVINDNKDFDNFVEVFPVTLTGQPPTKKHRADAGFPQDRCFYDKWRAAQFGKREGYLLYMSAIMKVNLNIIIFTGVIATRAFVKGAVISDYHGELVTAEEGRKILESSTDEMGYLYFFTSGSQQLCINAQTHPCRCHPTMETMGRKMNHSKNNLNVKPQHCKIKFPEGEKDTLLLVAARDISVDEELRFDYGVNRKSFRGEGLDREWLDE
ncbi:hypothetical protein Q5P01_000879 [Channa striata]|uniref:SET domain-containing protein n=1 Tax=Channa striata TaxID=64152 RepID=A0AA88IH23_CHASR|nr:hypothetical protein Q5P01_000879 [Channa striata]